MKYRNRMLWCGVVWCVFCIMSCCHLDLSTSQPPTSTSYFLQRHSLTLLFTSINTSFVRTTYPPCLPHYHPFSHMQILSLCTHSFTFSSSFSLLTLSQHYHTITQQQKNTAHAMPITCPIHPYPCLYGHTHTRLHLSGEVTRYCGPLYC